MSGDKWIPCSEKLPGIRVFYNTHGKQLSSDYVLVTFIQEANNFNQTIVTVGRLVQDTGFTSKWKLLYGYIHGSVIAWMPLPEPYKEAHQ